MLKINSFEQYQSDYKRSVENPECFWEDIAESFEWKKKWDKVLEWNFEEPDPKLRAPASFDGRITWKGLLGKVENQGGCGSCWAFSGVGALESQIAKVTGTPVVLSEQEMVDCVKNVMAPDKSSSCCNGCMGGEMYAVYQYLIENNKG